MAAMLRDARGQSPQTRTKRAPGDVHAARTTLNEEFIQGVYYPIRCHGWTTPL